MGRKIVDFHFSKESSQYFQEGSVQVSFSPFVKPQSHQVFPFHGQKKYSDQSKELIFPLNNLRHAAGWQNEKDVLAVCGPGWVQKRLKHSFHELKNDKRLMNFDDKENDPLLLNFVLDNLLEICFFSRNGDFRRLY